MECVTCRLDGRKIPYTNIKHETLATITTTGPNGITLELSMWNIGPRKVRMWAGGFPMLEQITWSRFARG